MAGATHEQSNLIHFVQMRCQAASIPSMHAVGAVLVRIALIASLVAVPTVLYVSVQAIVPYM